MIEMKGRRCNKNFIPAPQHIYKDDRGIYCSWTCYNHRNDSKKRKHKGVTMCSEDGTPIKTFDSSNSAAEYTGYEIKHIQEACRKSKVFNGFLWKYEG